MKYNLYLKKEQINAMTADIWYAAPSDFDLWNSYYSSNLETEIDIFHAYNNGLRNFNNILFWFRYLRKYFQN